MAIAKQKPTTASPMTPNTPKVQPPSYKSIIAEDNVTPVNSLLAYVGGSPWMVNYYHQILSEHTDLRDHDPSQVDIYQQYTKIVGLEIRVNRAIDSSQDAATALTTVTGAGSVYGFLVPNIGDMFIAPTGDGEDGLFRVTNSERKNFNRDSVFGIEYTLVTYVSKDPSRYANLEAKTNNTKYYDKTRLLEGADPILQSEEYTQVSNLREAYVTMVRHYFKSFYSKECGTLIIPGQQAAVYDPYLVNYLLKIIGSNDCLEVRNVTNITYSQDPYMTQPTFWDSMLDRDYNNLGFCNQFMGLVATQSFNNNAMIKGLRFSRMAYVVYPTQADTSLLTNDRPGLLVEAMASLTNPDVAAGSLASFIRNQDIQQNAAIPFIHPLLDNKSYVLSEAFYNGIGGQSVLEALVTDYLKCRMLDVSKLTALIGQYKAWGRLEQFYYLPILITLIKTAADTTY